MLRWIRKKPVLAAILFFTAIWASFPLAALARSYIANITYTKALCSPFLIIVFAGGSVAYAVRTYISLRRSRL